MGFGSGAFDVQILASRGRLKFGTALTGAALLLVPGVARAAVIAPPYSLSAPILSGVVAQEAAISPARDWRSASFDRIDPQDLTRLPAPHVAHFARLAAGDVDIDDGDVATSGDNQPGIATTSAGRTTITAGNVTTNGLYSAGIIATGPGPISVDVGGVTTSGDFSPGIYAASSGDAVSIKAGSVYTSGLSSSGIKAHGTNVAVTVDDVTTHGYNSGGISAFGAGPSASVDITINDAIRTYNARAIGVYAVSYGSIAIHDKGTIDTYGKNSSFVGTASAGIRAFAESEGDITIDGGGTIVTRGSRSQGVIAYTYDGDISISLGNISTSGTSADGIDAEASRYDPSTGAFFGTGNIDITTGNIAVRGASSAGLAADGIDVDVHVQGDVTATQRGVEIEAYGQGHIVVDGNVVASGNVGIGIRAVATDDLSIAVGGSITAYQGVTAVSLDGGVSVSTGDITGAAGGVYALAVSNGGDGTGRDVSVSTGNIATSASGAAAAGVIAISDDVGANVAVKTGTISTFGDFAAGVYAQSNGNVSISTGDITTRGLSATGIIAEGYSVDVKVGDVDTKAGIGIIAETSYGSTGHVNISAGNISTTYASDIGIVAIADTGAINIGVSSVSTQGDGAVGIYAHGVHLAPVSVTADDITTTGNGGTGIFAVSQGDVSVSVSGTVSTSGSANAHGIGSFGIYAVSVDQNVAINAASVSTAGESAFGIMAFGDNVDISTSNVSTTGLNGRGIVAISASRTNITSGNVTTLGDYASAIEAHSQGDAIVTTTGKISTQGAHAYGVFADSTGTIAVTNSGSIATAGEVAHGIYAAGSTASAIHVTNSGTIAVAGNDADAIFAKNAGSMSISSSGSVSAGGANGIGIAGVSFDDVATPIDLTIASSGKVATSGKGGVGILAEIIGNPYNVGRGIEAISITAGSVATSGAASTGIFAQNSYGRIAIDASSVTASGDGSAGIVALGGKDVAIKAGGVSSAGTAIYATAAGTLSLGVTGKVVSQGGIGFFAQNGAGATTIDVAAGGGIAAAGDAVRIETASGKVSIDNAGTIASGTGYAVEIGGMETAGGVRALVAPSGATIANSGTISGAVKLSGGDDVLTNSGTFIATRDSDFGSGDDLFANSGTLSVQPGTKPGAVMLLGLEHFQNSGIVDLRNGVAGDTLTLPGSYVGSGSAKLGLDVGANGITDRLVVTGAATGATTIVLNATAANATLFAKPVTLVQAGAGTSATAFNIADQNVGFVAYGLSYDATSGRFELSSTAGAAVHRLVKANEAAQAIWHQSADAWSSHMAMLRDTDQPIGRVWGQAYGKVDTRHDHDGGYSLSYRQDYYGGQAGVDLGGKRSEDGNGLLFGITGGYLSSHLNLRAGPERLRFDTFNAGVYGSFRAGPLFANLLGQYDHYHTSAGDSVNHWADTFNGSAYGAQAEFGARFGTDAFFAEPIASIAWQRTDLGTLQALGQSLRFDHDTGLTGTAGARLGGTFALKGGAKAVLYAKASYVHAFKGKGGLLFESGGASEDIAGTRLGDYGQGAIGVTILSTGRVSGFLEGDADVGGSTRGGGGRVGLSFKL